MCVCVCDCYFFSFGSKMFVIFIVVSAVAFSYSQPELVISSHICFVVFFFLAQFNIVQFYLWPIRKVLRNIVCRYVRVCKCVSD